MFYARINKTFIHSIGLLGKGSLQPPCPAEASGAEGQSVPATLPAKRALVPAALLSPFSPWSGRLAPPLSPRPNQGAPGPAPLPTPRRGSEHSIRKARRPDAPRKRKPAGGRTGVRAARAPTRPLPARASPDRHSPKHSHELARTRVFSHPRQPPPPRSNTRARSRPRSSRSPTSSTNTRGAIPSPTLAR